MTGFFLALLLVLTVSWLFVAHDPTRRGQHLSLPAIRLGLALFARPWRQRRAKDDGHHRRPAVLARSARQRIPRAVLGRDNVPSRHGAGNAVRRLADRAYDGVQDYPVDPDAGVLRRDRRRDHTFAATWLGIPVSTTHTITGSIIGVGAARKVSAVRWNVASNIVFAWVITLPAAALIAAVFYWLGKVIL